MVNCVKSLFKVNKHTNSDLLSCNADVISSVSSVSARDVDIFVLNPHWLFIKMSFLLMKESNLVQNNFSRIFENCGSRETGL